MESQFVAWLAYPWHVVYSALRSMACQDWQREHICPFCRSPHRNTGGTHDAWAYFSGCLQHLSSAPLCIGAMMLEDTLKGAGRPMIPPVLELLETLSTGKEAGEWMLAITILRYIGVVNPGGPCLGPFFWQRSRFNPVRDKTLKHGFCDRGSTSRATSSSHCQNLSHLGVSVGCSLHGVALVGCWKPVHLLDIHTFGFFLWSQLANGSQISRNSPCRLGMPALQRDCQPTFVGILCRRRSRHTSSLAAI